LTKEKELQTKAEIFSVISNNFPDLSEEQVDQLCDDVIARATKFNCISNIENREKWPDRDESKRENPVQFIRRVYAHELGLGTLERRLLSTYDFSLSKAYASWIRPERHPEDAIWEVQMRERRPPPESLEEARARSTAYHRTYRKRKYDRT
jgi:hypothetical protein